MSIDKRVLCLAPHPDDETFGCGGTLLAEAAAGAKLFWIIVTRATEEIGFDAARIAARNDEIKQVAEAFGFEATYELGFAATRLDAVPMLDVVGKISEVVGEVEPTDVYLPFRKDVHSDHAVVFDAGMAASKTFRAQSVRRVLAYETPSETDFDISPDSPGFRPNVYVNISSYIRQKLDIAAIYASEIGDHPFPRSLEGLRAFATVRGAASGFEAAEAFMLLRERLDPAPNDRQSDG